MFEWSFEDGPQWQVVNPNGFLASIQKPLLFAEDWFSKVKHFLKNREERQKVLSFFLIFSEDQDVVGNGERYYEHWYNLYLKFLEGNENTSIIWQEKNHSGNKVAKKTNKLFHLQKKSLTK